MSVYELVPSCSTLRGVKSTLISALLYVFSGFLYFLTATLKRVITTTVFTRMSGYNTQTGSEWKRETSQVN